MTDADGVHGLIIKNGIFTPIVTDSANSTTGVTYSVQQGAYYRVGDLIYFKINLIVTNVGNGGSGLLTIRNLPYMNKNIRSAVSMGPFEMVIAPEGYTQIVAYVQAQSEAIYFTALNHQTGVRMDVPYSWLLSNKFIDVAGTYLAA